jgi:CHAT domain-containing protein
LVGTWLTDESVGLPTAFLSAGAAGVVGSLWSVPDASTAVLMAEFYRIWRTEPVDPWIALTNPDPSRV